MSENAARCLLCKCCLYVCFLGSFHAWGRIAAHSSSFLPFENPFLQDHKTLCTPGMVLMWIKPLPEMLNFRWRTLCNNNKK